MYERIAKNKNKKVKFLLFVTVNKNYFGSENITNLLKQN